MHKHNRQKIIKSRRWFPNRNMPSSVCLVLFLGLIYAQPSKAASIRLVNGSYSCSGRVEIFYNGQWGALCEDDWTVEDGVVVCREMGCGVLIEEKKGSFYGEGSLPILMNKVKCVETESSLMDCNAQKGPITCDKKGAGVMCKPNVRVMDGSNSCSGRVEVYKDGKWGSVCDDGWDLSDAAVVCRELGCGNATEVKNGSYFGKGSGGPINIHGLNCDGSESTLSSCVSGIGAVDPSVCDISKTAGVICQSLIRLENGDGPCSGRVAVYHARQWGTVCDGGWDEKDGAVVCKEVGCGSLNLWTHQATYFGQGSGPIWVKDLECINTESTVRNCKVKSWGGTDCQHDKDAGVFCEYPIRLTGGSICSGAVEVYHNGLWGPVCFDEWDLADAAVVCRELKCGEALEANSAPIGVQPLMNNVNCDGSESTLKHCAWTSQTCSSKMHATVKCRLIKLVNGPSKCSGTVQVWKRSGTWETVCDSWTEKEMEVACKELGCWDEIGLPVAKPYSYSGPIAQGRVMPSCFGEEKTLTECDLNPINICGPAEVKCTEMITKYSLRIEVTGDPNDPAIRDNILSKIQEKLQTDANFTLGWITQPNGNIFQLKKT